jgi:ribulose-5-phosphate 4-epimerase/fuculose-1-phosphate aldolase
VSDPVYEMRLKITEIGRLMFERQLTDAAGGNISARVEDLVCITPRYAGGKHQWRLRPEQVIVTDLSGNHLEGEGVISREAKVHYRLYQEFSDGSAIIHAHARNALVFAAASSPIEPVLEGTRKFGTIRVSKYAPSHSNELAEFIAEEIRGQEERIRVQAVGVLAPWHGLFVLGKDLDAAFDAAERIDVNARCILLSRLLPRGEPDGEPPSPQAMRSELEEARRRFA